MPMCCCLGVVAPFASSFTSTTFGIIGRIFNDSVERPDITLVSLLLHLLLRVVHAGVPEEMSEDGEHEDQVEETDEHREREEHLHVLDESEALHQEAGDDPEKQVPLLDPVEKLVVAIVKGARLQVCYRARAGETETTEALPRGRQVQDPDQANQELPPQDPKLEVVAVLGSSR